MLRILVFFESQGSWHCRTKKNTEESDLLDAITAIKAENISDNVGSY